MLIITSDRAKEKMEIAGQGCREQMYIVYVQAFPMMLMKTFFSIISCKWGKSFIYTYDTMSMFTKGLKIDFNLFLPFFLSIQHSYLGGYGLCIFGCFQFSNSHMLSLGIYTCMVPICECEQWLPQIFLLSEQLDLRADYQYLTFHLNKMASLFLPE